MDAALDNPVYHALCSGDAHLARGTATVKYFDDDVSPFASFDDNYKEGFDELAQLLPAGRVILYPTRKTFKEPNGWKLLHEVEGLQFIYTEPPKLQHDDSSLVPLNEANAEEMVALATLTKPGPFSMRTIEFGNYYGVFNDGRLVAMAGQRLHPGRYSEISAVCTHPDYAGKGFAAQLTQRQVFLIEKENRIPFLHVRADNARAIALYERLAFSLNGRMNFYVMKRS